MIFYPAGSLENTQVERDYRSEHFAAIAADFETVIFNFDALTRGENIETVLRRAGTRETPVKAVYRGWMLSENDYATLFHGLRDKGFSLINTPESYA